MNARRGASSIGCLFTLLIVAAVLYFGANVGEAYWRFYEYRDAMRQQVRFHARSPNETIIARLRAAADSLDLPEAADKITIRRTRTSIIIEAEYYEHVEFPMYVREIRFHPRAEGPL